MIAAAGVDAVEFSGGLQASPPERVPFRPYILSEDQEAYFLRL